MDRKLVGTATRYIAGRNAIQTVYWRKTTDVEGRGLLKYSKTYCLGNQPTKEMLEKYSPKFANGTREVFSVVRRGNDNN